LVEKDIVQEAANIQEFRRDMQERYSIVNAIYNIEVAVESDSDSSDELVRFDTPPAAMADQDTSGPDTVMIDAPVPNSLALVMRPLLSPSLPDIVEKESLRLQQAPEELSTLAPVDNELMHLKASEEEERRWKNTCPECGLFVTGM
jgi:hypothetical protein